MSRKNIITLTESASDRVKYLLEQRGKVSLGIKVKVVSGGCSGLKYSIEYADEIGKFDEVIEDKGVKIIVDAKAVLHLIGSEMDYVEEKFKSGFIFNNPNQKGSCGCGESFHT
jgi:iron-sulfur cluster assembly protein